ncbi:class I SAM-dependent methyltransferase [Lutispora thermophila]|uniref:Methyltransferase domain-containing protein n=1 Tax=Lutispora thermophila DSM 19022 TaxID=1122184 RepID=A0A1M6CKB3_9FIRM|nr:class I SAM-dependent methyltransferase [Lutispora thermophila]SHI61446.1 Methyltransferase domain-containing protein [Lutispora thermophila DSM 19022]
MSSEQFHKITKGEPPRELAKKIIKYINNDCLILDCGSGAGNDAIFFASQGYKVIALDKETKVLENRLKSLSDIKDRITVIESDIMDFEFKEIGCFYSSLTLSFLSRKNFYILWSNIRHKLKKHSVIGINIFGNRDEWFRETDDMTFMDKEEFASLFTGFTILEFLEKEKLGTCMGENGMTKDKKWHIFECIAKL